MGQLFADGGWAMWPLLILLIVGVAVTIERLITLSKAAINAEEFFKNLEETLRNGDPDQAAELCSRTPGPVATVIHAGLLRINRGLDHVEKSIENYGRSGNGFPRTGHGVAVDGGQPRPHDRLSGDGERYDRGFPGH